LKLATAPHRNSLEDYFFELPAELIAQTPALKRSESRLLLVGEKLADTRFAQLGEHLRANDLLIFNDSRVIKARLLGHKDSGGQIEVLVERTLSEHQALVQLKASKKPRQGSKLFFSAPTTSKSGAQLADATSASPKAVTSASASASATVLGRQGEFFQLQFEQPVLEVLETMGRLPLPPYIEHSPDLDDESRYQTVYAKHDGSVAAPTAGLHFEDSLFAALEAKGIKRSFVTLHVGAGTFQPVRSENLDEHKMHSERFQIDSGCAQAITEARQKGGRVFAVGTTSLRTLESAAALQDSRGELKPCQGETDLFIRPGYDFRIVDGLITNFHLPKSTLLMLVSAFAGYETIRAAYAHAIAKRYRFFSYGDAMLLTRQKPNPLTEPLN
jgi:S-adenosylmethionine:tRNA ribosyltransferase-isomerase